MMQMSVPGAQALADLGSFLSILELASDPKKAKAAVNAIADERKKHDDALAASIERVRVAEAAEASAHAAIAKAAQSEANANSEVDKLLRLRASNKAAEDEAKAEAAAAAKVNDEKLKNLDAVRAEIAQREAAMVASFKAQSAAVAEVKANAEELDIRAAGVMEEALAMKAEYAARLAKIKALAE